jgi:hypothetical protein
LASVVKLPAATAVSTMSLLLPPSLAEIGATITAIAHAAANIQPVSFDFMFISPLVL